MTEIKNNTLLLHIYYTDSLVYTLGGTTSTIASNPGYHLALLRLDLDGQLITSEKNITDTEDVYFSDLITLPDGTYQGAGSFGDSMSLTTPSGISTIYSEGKNDAFIARFDQNFELLWIKTIGGNGNDYMEKTFLTKDDLTYYCMNHNSTITIETINGPITFTGNGETDGIFGSISIDGSIQTAFGLGGELGDEVRSIVADAEGNMYICGYFEGDINFAHPSDPPANFTSAGSTEAFLAKYDAAGSLVWTRVFMDSDYGGIYNMEISRGTDLYVGGALNGHADLDPGPDSIIINTTNFWDDVIFEKFNLDGDLKWAYSLPGNESCGIRNLVLSTDGKFFVHGYYYDTLDCNPSEDTFEIVSQDGSSDMFLIAFTEENVITGTASPAPLQTIIYPNPSPGEIMLNSDIPIEEVTVCNLDGKLLNVDAKISGSSCQLNMGGLSPGIYFVKVSSGDRVSVSKIVKQ